MKIRMLGTGYGECKIKKFASKDFRRRGGVILDSKILIDAPEDIFDLADELGLSDILEGVGAVFISHSHKGHFSPEAIERLARRRELFVFADDNVLEAIPDAPTIIKTALSPFVPVELGGYAVTPLPANHETEEPTEQCYNFLFEGERTLFYALDGGFINAGAWHKLAAAKLDAVIMDCAAELEAPSVKLLGHCGYEMNKTLRGILISAKAATEKTRFILSHVPSPRRRSVHEELNANAAEDGFTVAYDGYFLNL